MVKDLPYEVLSIIFGHLDKRQIKLEKQHTEAIEVAGKDLYGCQLTCKQWIKPAQQIIYKDVYIGSKL